jgi:hypothetical protein
MSVSIGSQSLDGPHPAGTAESWYPSTLSLDDAPVQRSIAPPARAEPEIEIVSMVSEADVLYWTQRFGVTIYAVRAAIAATHSRSARIVDEYLRSSGLT